jgi:hypothetical protein
LIGALLYVIVDVVTGGGVVSAIGPAVIVGLFTVGLSS